MTIILLSGGSGKRLWPLSNDVRAKQFLKLFKTKDGGRESMVQRMYRMIKEVDTSSSVYIATSENQVAAIKEQLGDAVGISVEPCRRDTFPAIVLAAAYLHDIQGVQKNEAVIVCPVDPYVEEDFFDLLADLQGQAEKNVSNLTLIGVEPTYPSEKYGYIIPETVDPVSIVSEFKEKPGRETAEEYISQGALWNAGVFAFRLSYVLGIADDVFGSSDYSYLFDNYESLPKISFDYAVVEREKNIRVMRFSGAWKDLGTWNTLTETMEDAVSGNAVEVLCENTHVINELQIPLIAFGVNDLAITATPDGILVVDKDHSDCLKDYVPEQRVMYEKRIWGEYRVIDYQMQGNGTNSLTKHMIVKAGQHISYQRHALRTEIWTIIEGTGSIILDGTLTEIWRGYTVSIKPGTGHAVKANTEMHIIEVQIGNELTEDDIERLDWNSEWDN